MSKYEYNIPSRGSDYWAYIEGYDEEDAAINAGQHYNEDGDYTLMNDSILILIREKEEAPVHIFSVSAEPDIHYSSCEVDDLKCRHCGKDLKEVVLTEGIYESSGYTYCNHTHYREWYKKQYNVKD